MGQNHNYNLLQNHQCDCYDLLVNHNYNLLQNHNCNLLQNHQHGCYDLLVNHNYNLPQNHQYDCYDLLVNHNYNLLQNHHYNLLQNHQYIANLGGYQHDELYIGTVEERVAKNLGADQSRLNAGKGHILPMPAYVNNAPQALIDLMGDDVSCIGGDGVIVTWVVMVV